MMLCVILNRLLNKCKWCRFEFSKVDIISSTCYQHFKEGWILKLLTRYWISTARAILNFLRDCGIFPVIFELHSLPQSTWTMAPPAMKSDRSARFGHQRVHMYVMLTGFCEFVIYTITKEFGVTSSPDRQWTAVIKTETICCHRFGYISSHNTPLIGFPTTSGVSDHPRVYVITFTRWEHSPHFRILRFINAEISPDHRWMQQGKLLMYPTILTRCPITVDQSEISRDSRYLYFSPRPGYLSALRNILPYT